MQQVVQISLSGQPAVFRLEMDAYDALRRYLESADERLRDEHDAEEVMNDLEQAIGEKLAARVRSEQSVVTLAEVESVLAAIGPVETDAVEPPVPDIPRGRRRLYRIQEGQDIFGVCTGLSAYSNIDVDWVRTIFILLALATGGALILVYIALGFLLPVVATRKEWLAMHTTLPNAI